MYIESPRRFSTPAKYRLAKLCFALGFVGVIFCLYMISGYGLSGEQSKLSLWLVILTIVFVFGMVAGVAFYYYRARIKDADVGLVEIETLASMAKLNNDKDVSDK